MSRSPRLVASRSSSSSAARRSTALSSRSSSSTIPSLGGRGRHTETPPARIEHSPPGVRRTRAKLRATTGERKRAAAVLGLMRRWNAVETTERTLRRLPGLVRQTGEAVHVGGIEIGSGLTSALGFATSCLSHVQLCRLRETLLPAVDAERPLDPADCVPRPRPLRSRTDVEEVALEPRPHLAIAQPVVAIVQRRGVAAEEAADDSGDDRPLLRHRLAFEPFHHRSGNHHGIEPLEAQARSRDVDLQLPVEAEASRLLVCDVEQRPEIRRAIHGFARRVDGFAELPRELGSGARPMRVALLPRVAELGDASGLAGRDEHRVEAEALRSRRPRVRSFRRACPRRRPRARRARRRRSRRRTVPDGRPRRRRDSSRRPDGVAGGPARRVHTRGAVRAPCLEAGVLADGPRVGRRVGTTEPRLDPRVVLVRRARPRVEGRPR